MPLDSFTILYIAAGIVLVLLLWIIRLEWKVYNLLKGQSGRSLEASFVATKKSVDGLERYRRELEQYLSGVEERLRRSIQGVSTIRFNPFKGGGTGGNQSFAVSLLDEKGDGVVFSSLYARDRMSVFAKPIKDGVSEFELTAEEKEVIEKAKKTTV